MYNKKMTPSSPHQLLVELFHQAKQAHFQAHQESDGADPEWPLWYAGYLLDPIRQLLQIELTKSELVYLLVLVDQEQRLASPAADWTSYYAGFFLQRFPQPAAEKGK